MIGRVIPVTSVSWNASVPIVAVGTWYGAHVRTDIQTVLDFIQDAIDDAGE